MSAYRFWMANRCLAVAAVLFTAFTALNLSTDKALASTVIVEGNYDAPTIQGICKALGGSFGANVSAYGCKTSKGSIECNWDGQCVGHCATCGPAIAHQGGGAIQGVLSGTTLKPGGTTTQPVGGAGSGNNPTNPPKGNAPPPTTPIKGNNPPVAAPITLKPIKAPPTAPSHPAPVILLQHDDNGHAGDSEHGGKH
jgi:hypothetical protein